MKSLHASHFTNQQPGTTLSRHRLTLMLTAAHHRILHGTGPHAAAKSNYRNAQKHYDSVEYVK